MAKYGSNIYGATIYGEAPKLAYSVEPMGITVINFTETYVNWKNPTGNFTKIRLVRNQVGFPEHSEDGVIVWEENASEGTVSRSLFRDGEDNPNSIPITPGRQVYYKMFLFTTGKVWVTAGTTTDIIPSNHNAQSKLLDILPKVYTTDEQSPLAIVNPDSTLAKFLGGISLTYEQLLTFIDLLKPHHSNEDLPFALIPNETGTLGLNQERNLPTKNQKMLIREALYLYKNKGTLLALNAYVEALTGWAPTTTVSSNLLLGPQDSTFYLTTGNWVPTNATLSSDTTQAPATGANVIDDQYTCKVIASDSFTMDLGADDPISKGVPVTAGSEYTASVQIKSPSSAGNSAIAVAWYDGKGSVISSDTGNTVSANNTWKVSKITATAPAGAVYASLEISSNSAGTYFVDQVCLQLGNTVAFDEARAITTFVSPNKTNFVPNPSFEVSTTDSWSKTGSVTITQDSDVSSEAYTGTNSAKLVATGPWTFTTPDIPVIAGNYYVVSSFLKSSSDITLSLIAKDVDGNVVSTDTYSPGTVASWGRFSGTSVVDAASLAVTYDLEFSGDSGTFYIDCVQFEKGGLPVYGPVTNVDGSSTYGVVGLNATEYFDGNLPSSFGSVWQGTANNSPSSVYYGKDLKMTRLTQTFPEWMVPNLFWRITSYAGVEATNPIV